MKHEIIEKLHADFEQIVKKDTQRGTEFWMARELMVLLGSILCGRREKDGAAT